MIGFDTARIIAAIVRVLNSNYDYTAAAGRYFKPEDIESYEVWYIGIRIRFKKGVLPKRRFVMLSKTAVCAKLAPSPKEVTFAPDGKMCGDKLHLSTYRYNWDDTGEEHTWTVSIGYETKSEATNFKDWLWHNKYCAHSTLRKAKRTQGTWELKIWGIDKDLLDSLIAHYSNKLIKVIKPNGAYRFMLGEQMLTSVYTKSELRAEIERHIKAGYQIECHNPSNGQVYKARFEDNEIKYSLVA